VGAARIRSRGDRASPLRVCCRSSHQTPTLPLTRTTNRRMRAATVAILAAALGATGCGASGNSRAANTARAVTLQWLTALGNGDGKTVCASLGKKLRAIEDQNARGLGAHVTCAQSESAHPPGISGREVRQLELARRQSTLGLRIETVTVDGNRATVHYSWLVPKHPSPVLSFRRPSHGNRVEDVATLHREAGRWKIG